MTKRAFMCFPNHKFSHRTQIHTVSYLLVELTWYTNDRHIFAFMSHGCHMICLPKESKAGVLRGFGAWTHCPLTATATNPHQERNIAMSGEMGSSFYQLLQINSEAK